MQVENRTVIKVVAGTGLLIAAVMSLNLLLRPAEELTLDAAALRAITAESTFQTVSGNGSQAVHVFLSTECSFCRQIEPELDQLKNVTVYRHLLPGHTAAGRVAANSVWCSNDPAAAWKNHVTGQPVVPTTCTGRALDKNLALAKRLGITMTPTIVFEDGHVSAGMHSVDQINRLIERSLAR